ncbi:protein translocase SecDF, variant type [Spiroplasma floricola]|uniref:Bifunctional preprotein translocase subunit SecD/SecF n=1 Tax=Spiroplasma floricola 23-6 TaxID=1336749 RepID=A0A2K8SDI2_9MOLU|nr:protein translocase SecDF, variant type [Spiroplasma floricola]AUB31483.1 bifunctional preprotein translocase subunit SecD/SecF [Spiroplasma floricola 23-6]
MIKLNINEKNIRKKQKKPILKSFAILLIVCSLILGIVFSTWKFSENIRLGSDFKGYYSALVSVDNLNEENNNNGQPNGNSTEGAKALNQRLNPMGNNQIIIEKAGNNFLKVLSPVDAYQNETVFRNQIQKNGGIVLLDAKNYSDLQITTNNNKIERKGINEFFTGAKATSITASNQKHPAISYKLNGDAFKSLLPSSSAEQQTTYADDKALNLFILLDADGFYNDIRNYYNLIKGTAQQRIEEFFRVVVQPLREIYNNSSTSAEVKQILFDLFYGNWDVKTSSGVSYKRSGSLIETKEPSLATATAFTEIVGSFKYLSETSKYVYDSNAVTKDFENDGRYSKNVSLWSQSGILTDSNMKVNEIFAKINPTLIQYVGTNGQSFNEVYWNNLRTNYFLFTGPVTESKSTTAGGGYIEGDNLITTVDSYAKSEIGASLFNAAGKGFVFTVNSIATLDGTVTTIMLWAGLTFLLIIALCLIIYMGFFYRLLGLFAMIITLAIIGMTLLSLSWFNLTVGPETIISAFILIALNIEIFSTLFENMKESYYLKQRGLKTSFNISIKENIGLAADLVIALLIPSMCMFWITSNAIRSMAIMLAMGSFFTVLFTILISVILFKLILNSPWFTNKSNLFALNTDFANQGKFLLNYKIRRVENKIKKLESKESKNEILINSLKDKLKQLNEKLTLIKEKEISKTDKRQLLAKEKLNKKVDKLKSKISTLDENKKAKKIQKLNFKINELIFIRDDKTQSIIEEEGQIITSTNEKLKIKTVERNIKNGAKMISLFGVFILALSIGFGFLFGLRFDHTFGGRTDYTLWGDNIQTAYYGMVDQTFEDQDPKTKELEEKRNKLKTEYEEYEKTHSSSEQLSAVRLKQAEVVSEYWNFVYSKTYYVNYLSNSLNSSKLYKNHNYSVSYGSQFVYNGSSTNQNWITLTVYTQNLKQSAIIKKLFNIWGIDKQQNITETNGFITKAIKPATMLWTLKQIAITVAVIILALIIYILIRFKWTYYIAMIVAIIVAPVISVSLITALQIPLGNASIIAIVSSLLFTIISLFMIFGKSRSLISSKNEKSLIDFFNKEIEIVYDTKTFKKQMNDELFNLKNEMRLNIKTNSLSKEEKKKLKLEFKEIKHNKKIEFKKIKKENKIKINRVGKQNNYLSEVLVKSFKFGLVRCSLLIALYSLVGIVILATMPTILSFGLAIIIGTVVTSLVVLFISLPLWVIFEQIRIRNKLARKRFINGLYVSNEEQIIEGIND